MGIFGKKKEKVLDWRENYKIPEKRTVRRTHSSMKRNSNSEKRDSDSDMEFLGNLAGSGSSTDSELTWDSDSSSSSSHEESSDKKQKLVKRLLEMTNRMEDMSNQIYHLKQRVELLEKKLKISFE